MEASIIYDYRIFKLEQDGRVLIANYFSTNPPPAVGTVIAIDRFKEDPAYPDHVMVVSLEHAPSDEPSIVNQAVVIYVIVEPAEHIE